MAFFPAFNIWPHLIATTLPRYLSNTLLLMAAVGLSSAIVGTGVAWLISMYRFPLSRSLEWALLLPLAIPAYIGAYALVDFLEYAGPVQTGLRTIFGWESARDYAFPEIRSRGAAVIVLSASLYPYVYLLARAAFREQSACSYEVAEALGAGALRRFFRLALPLTRPAIAAGTAIVMMETVNDFGTVDYFAVQTLTTGVFSVWLESYNAGGAAQIATVLLVLILILILILVTLEKVSRRNSRFFHLGRRQRPIERRRLRGHRAALACFACLVPFGVGFVLPFSVILWHALRNGDRWVDPGLAAALKNTLVTGGSAAALTVIGALVMVYGVRLSGRRLPRLILPATTIGYAAPGAVLAVGVLIPLASVDHRLADAIQSLTGRDPGLLLTGTAFAIVFAYTVRFFAIAVGATDAAMGRVTPSLPMAARSFWGAREPGPCTPFTFR